MPMEKERYEELLNKLNNPELEHAERVDILTELRNDYNTVYEDFEKYTQQVEHLKKDNDDLVRANSKLFRSAGFLNEEDQKEEEKTELSETIRIEDLENGL